MARDADGNTSNCLFTVDVVDITAPVLDCPDDMVVQCTSHDGAIVEYATPRVTNECNGEPVVVCDPPSGTLFAPGTTTVTCTATDAVGNTGTCTFDVTVQCVDLGVLRGDSNSSGVIDISDVSYTLAYLYNGGPEPSCIAAADSTGNGRINIADMIFTLNWLFRSGPNHPELLSC